MGCRRGMPARTLLGHGFEYDESPEDSRWISARLLALDLFSDVPWVLVSSCDPSNGFRLHLRLNWEHCTLRSEDSSRDRPRENTSMLNHLTGKSFVFKIKLTDYNLKDGFENYTVVKIFEADKSVETYEFRSENAEEAEMKGKRNAGKMLTDGNDGLAKNVLAASDSSFPFWQEITHSKAISCICFSTSSIGMHASIICVVV
ncbi:hypothetical protein LXL04_017424 [Taraxacum kok-saghyz]